MSWRLTLGLAACFNTLPLAIGVDILSDFDATVNGLTLHSARASPPWGDRTVYTDPGDIPETGVTRQYDLTVGRCTLAPDGVKKDMICINGQFPGPTLSADWGDNFEVLVRNNLTDPEDGTAIHWHGLLQFGSPMADGVPGISQCPIAPGSSLLYKFRAETYGSSWYHSHYTAQYTDGAYGPIVIHGPTSQPYDVDLGPILISDWYHANSRDIVAKAMSSNPLDSQLIFADGSLINGRMDYDCSITASTTTCTPKSGLSKLRFQPGKTHLLRFINTSTFAVILVSIDSHTMTVVANDFVPVKPYTATTLTLAAGQRTDVIVTAKPSLKSLNGAYWLRTRQPTLCALAFQPFALAAIYYDDNGFNNNALPLTLPQLDFVTPRLLNCSNDALANTEPSWSIEPPAEPDATATINITNSANGTGQLLYYMSGSTFHADYNTPVLDSVQKGQTTFAEGLNVYNFGTNKSIRLIFNNGVPFAHPMHIHGQDFFVLAEGDGAWDQKTIVRPSNPQRRDTQLLRPSGYLVVQLHSNNPGVWPLHCHFSWHVSQGLIINVVQRPDLVREYQNITDVMKQSCDAWDDWTANHIVDQIDSGVKFLRAVKRQWHRGGINGLWKLVKRLFNHNARV